MQTLIVNTNNDSQRDLFVQLAKELRLRYEIVEEPTAEAKAWLKISEQSFSEEWDSAEDQQWDHYLKNMEYVPKR